MMPGSGCRHLKIAGRVIISRLFHVTRQQPRKLRHIRVNPRIQFWGDTGRVDRTLGAGRATRKEYLAGFLFLWHYSERLCTYRIDTILKRRPPCLTIWLFWKRKDPISWKSS